MKLLKKVGLCLLALVLTTTSVEAVIAPVTQTSDRVEIKELAVNPESHIELIKQKVDKYANLYNVKPSLMRSIINCESSYNPSAVGDNGTSFGLSQIHLPAHPDITKEQAFNEDFAIEFMANALSKGQGKMWTCWQMLQ